MVLPVGGDEVNTSTSPKFNKLDFVPTISKFVFGNCLDVENFNISQITFEMRNFHWIIIKMLYRKPYILARADDLDLLFMWMLLSDKRHNWIKFILLRIECFRSIPKVSPFYSSFVQYILELNGITPSDSDLVKSINLVDASTINQMRYYRDEKME